MKPSNIIRRVRYTYLSWKVISVIGLDTPFPLIGHGGLGDGPDAPLHLGVIKFKSAVPSGVVAATHVADLMGPRL